VISLVKNELAKFCVLKKMLQSSQLHTNHNQSCFGSFSKKRLRKFWVLYYMKLM